MNRVSEGIKSFLVDSRGLLHEMEMGLLRLELEEQRNERQVLRSIVVTATALENSAGQLGLDEIVRFTRQLEVILAKVDNIAEAVLLNLIELFQDCCEHIKHLLELVASGMEIDPQTRHHGDLIIEMIMLSYLSICNDYCLSLLLDLPEPGSRVIQYSGSARAFAQ
ncbi:MAG: hypothetical protein RQ899_09180 [Pseudomonadales bacterium]|nr:hypothetical protein [Pseudomonadales bacterium]